MDASAVAEVKAHFARVTYGAVLHATRKSFGALRRRVGSKAAGGFLFVERPFFEVTVELAVPHVVLAPSLEERFRAPSTAWRRRSSARASRSSGGETPT